MPTGDGCITPFELNDCGKQAPKRLEDIKTSHKSVSSCRKSPMVGAQGFCDARVRVADLNAVIAARVPVGTDDALEYLPGGGGVFRRRSVRVLIALSGVAVITFLG